jgi:electron transfer flavoprotein alpha/beta subunit
MKILVCISKTPDTTAKIAFTENNTKFSGDGVQWIINPYDEWYALVKAIELKEKDPTIVIHLATVGLADADPIIRKALALGGDEAFRVNVEKGDSYYTANAATLEMKFAMKSIDFFCKQKRQSRQEIKKQLQQKSLHLRWRQKLP